MTALPPTIRAVSDVSRYLRTLLDADDLLSDLWVSGEVTNFTRAASGHIYFTLKDERSAIRCAFFRNRQGRGGGPPIDNGDALVVHGALSVYEPRGELSFVVDFVQPGGTGALAAEFERRRQRLEEEGLFAPERKRELPRFPRRVGVVTSPTGAVFHDIASVLGRRWPLATLLLQPATVQGPEAAPEVVNALRALAQEHAPDVIILARGGGAAEELWAFNEEAVVRAVFGSPVPVVSAIGHETDTVLTDLAADRRAPTPSAAAEMVAPDRADVARDVAMLAARGEVRVARAVADARQRALLLTASLRASLPDLTARRRRVSEHARTLLHHAGAAATRAAERTAGLGGRLEVLSPLSTLGRGYAMIERPDGSSVTSAAALHEGDRVRLRLSGGERPARITAASESGGGGDTP